MLDNQVIWYLCSSENKDSIDILSNYSLASEPTYGYKNMILLNLLKWIAVR